MSIVNRVPAWGNVPPIACLLLLTVASTAWGQSQTAASPAAAAVNPDEIVLTVGEKSFTAAEFEKIASALPPQFRAMLGSLGKRGFAEQFANLYGLAMEGEKRQLDQGEEFQQMLDFDRRVLLAQITMNAVAMESATVGPEEVGYYYQTHAADFEQIKVTGIYIPFAPLSGASPGTVRSTSAMPAYTEQQAQRKALEIRARIRSGQDMAALAKAESEHPTASKGGDFGYFGRTQTQLPAGIVNSIFSLQPNQVSAPMKQGQGFFVFRVEDKRVQPLEEVRQAIQASLSIQKVNRRIEALKDSYPVELDLNYFPVEAAPAPSAPK